MTETIWMAAPPEVHSALLSGGPGPGSLLASAGAWSSLGTEYAEAADELTALLSAMQAGAWDGPTAQAYVAAHAPYLSWLMQASADSAATATQQEAAAAAYTAALAAMPTLGELAANHATHAVLSATNFFGINTIPIAVNEADYVRMWIQAATTMSIYQGVSAAAVAASPHTTVAPAIVSGDGTAAPAAPYDPITAFFDFLSAVERVFNSVGGEGGGDLFSYIFSVPPGTDPVSWFVGKISTLSSPTSGYPALLQGLVSAAGDNPALLALAYLFGAAAIGYDLAIQVIQFLVTFPLLAVGLIPLAAVPAALAGLAAGGVVGIAELHAHLPTGVEPIADAPIAPAVSPAPTTVSGPAAPATAPAAPTPALAPAAPAPAPAFAAPSAPGAPPPPGGTGPFPYVVGGLTRMASQASAKASAKRKAPQPDIVANPAAAAAAASAREKRRARRRRRTEMLGRGYQYADLDVDTGQDPESAPRGPGEGLPTAASDRGAGPLGFAGTTRRETVAEAAGLTTLAGDAFAGGPREPMMPSTWALDESGEAREGKDDT